MKNITLLFLIALLASSCAGFRAPNFNTVNIGMTKEEVVKRLGNKYTVISAKKYDDGILEIYQYLNIASVVSSSTSDSDYHWLFFFNNQLDEWGPKTNYAPFNEYNYYRKHRNRQ